MRFAASAVSALRCPWLIDLIPFAADTVAFSARAQLLVSKLGRSSKPAPRFLVVVRILLSHVDFGAEKLSMSVSQTQKAVHIVVTVAKDGVTTTTLERKIPLITIKSISMSNLRDDWFVRDPLWHALLLLICSTGFKHE